MRALDEGQFGRDGVDRIDDVVVIGEVELVGGLRQVKAFVHAYVAMGVDGADPCRHDVGLILADRFGGGHYLPVDVGKANDVVVHEVDGAHAAAGQAFGSVSAHATHAEHGDPRVGERIHSGGA